MLPLTGANRESRDCSTTDTRLPRSIMITGEFASVAYIIHTSGMDYIWGVSQPIAMAYTYFDKGE